MVKSQTLAGRVLEWLPRRRRAGAALLAALAGLCVAAALARAELSSSGNLFITFNGGILPKALPRDSRAPISVWMAGKVRTLSGEKPPSLRTVTIALNRNGRLETQGLPICRRSQIEAATSAQAMRACGDALVGTGRYRARTTFPGQPPTPSIGKILAFNSKVGGREAILGQVFTTQPAQSTSVIDFAIKRGPGEFGTVLDGSVPGSLSRFSYLKRISLKLHRSYAYHGRSHSYLSAPCSAPRGLQRASFPFVRASMSFADGRSLSATLTRTCAVRG